MAVHRRIPRTTTAAGFGTALSAVRKVLNAVPDTGRTRVYMSRPALTAGLVMTSLEDVPVGPKEAARIVGLSLAGLRLAIRKKRLPPPIYPLPKAPRWFPSELR